MGKNSVSVPIGAELLSTAANAGPSLADVGKCRALRGSGAPPRTRTHYERILELLRERGPAGVTSIELHDAVGHPFGRTPRNRISEMRKDGCLIETVQVPGGCRWILVRDAEGNKTSDWYERTTGKPRPSGHPWKTAFSPKRLADPDTFVLTPPEPRT
jgi:hypothetical protein